MFNTLRKAYWDVVTQDGNDSNERAELIAGMSKEDLELFAVKEGTTCKVCTVDGTVYPTPKSMEYVDYIQLRLYTDVEVKNNRKLKETNEK